MYCSMFVFLLLNSVCIQCARFMRMLQVFSVFSVSVAELQRHILVWRVYYIVMSRFCVHADISWDEGGRGSDGESSGFVWMWPKLSYHNTRKSLWKNGIFTSGTWLLHSVLNMMQPSQSNCGPDIYINHYKFVQFMFKSVWVVRGVFVWSTSGISSLCDAQKVHECPACECLQMSHIVQVLLFDRIEEDSAGRLWLQLSESLGFSLGAVIWMRNRGVYHPSAFVKNMTYDKHSRGKACC